MPSSACRYDEPVVQVNRLHILKRFYQYLHQGTGRRETRSSCTALPHLLARAYQDFVQSTPAQEKVFKVFQDVGGTQHVRVSTLRDSLVSQRREARAA
jgi:nitrogenase-stabilizing/protective protein